MKLPVPNYSWEHNTFRKKPYIKRWAKEHEAVVKLNNKTTVINVEILEQTKDELKIPTKYMVTYHLRSIVSLEDNGQDPVYGEEHKAEFELPKEYPAKACTIYMRTPVWHPNIRSKGTYVGRVCANSDLFGPTYMLDQLILRVGEVLQYKNYHALNTWPYPDDGDAAKWVLDYAEPNDIVNKWKEIFTDDRELIFWDEKLVEEKKPKIKIKSSKDISTGPVQKLKFGLKKKEDE